jgi:hypothetical protein
MAQLKLRVPKPIKVLNADVEIEVRDNDDQLLGTLMLSRGSLDWYPKNTRIPHRRRWKKFIEFMEEGNLYRGRSL